MSDIPPTSARLRQVSRKLWEYSRGHRTWLVRGTFASFVFVGARLALPFPIRSLAKPWLNANPGSDVAASVLDGGMDPGLAVGGSLLLLLTLLGLADLYQRLCFARFAIATMRSTRGIAIRGIREREPDATSVRSGDLVARLIGDLARAKAGIKGFLIHVLTNAVLLAGVLVVLATVSGTLALLFGGACAVVGGFAFASGRKMFRVAHRFRHQEGKLANRIQKALGGDYGDKSVRRLNRRSGKNEAELTRLQGIATSVTHGVLGAVILAALLLGEGQLSTGTIESGDLLLFLLYALLLRAPMVKIVRQWARMGKVLACVERIVELCEPTRTRRLELVPLTDALRLDGVKVSTKKVGGVRTRRLGPLDLTLRRDEHVLILGKDRSGKTTLLRALAGIERPRRGRILWDEENVSRPGARQRSGAIHYLPDRPSWNRTPVARLLYLQHSGATPGKLALREILGAWGGARPVKRRCSTWETEVGSDDMSLAEAKALGLTRALRSPASVLLLDDPFTFMSRQQRAAALQAIRARTGLVVVALRTLDEGVESFDRVLTLRKGRMVVPPSATEPASPSVAGGS